MLAIEVAVGMTSMPFVYVSGPSKEWRGITSASRAMSRGGWYGTTKAAACTAKFRPGRTHVVVEFPDEAHAARFERYLKSGSGRAFAKRHFG